MPIRHILMRTHVHAALLVLLSAISIVPAGAQADSAARRASASESSRGSPNGSFTLEQILSYPFTENLVAAPSGATIAWVFNRSGVRNIWVAQGPGFKAHPVTDYRADDGQELTNLSISPDGETVVYVRGGDHDANWPAEGKLQPDPAHSPIQPKLGIWTVPTVGASSQIPGQTPSQTPSQAPKLLAEGDEPVLSPRGDRIAFTREHQIWVVPVDGSAPARRLFFARGDNGSPVWSPTGDRLAFVSDRGDHSFIGIFASDSTAIHYLAPSTSHDRSPRWSPDGGRIAFVRLPGTGGVPQTLLELHPRPWAIWVADVATDTGRRVWQSPNTLAGSVPTTEGGTNLLWGAGGRLIFLSDMDGWPHLYSVPEAGGTPLLLTPGAFMAEYAAMTPDHRSIVYNANTGTTPGDGDRRHLFRVPVDRAAPVQLTSGDGMQWAPTVTGDGRTVAFIGAGARVPPLPEVISLNGGSPQTLGKEVIPATFPLAQLVVPKPVTFKAADGTEVHGQLFERSGTQARRPGIVFVHGGPPRQMLLGWNGMAYYSNAYAVNQYLANHGYVVLSVNYRLGIGYGHNFHHPEHAGASGASEYQDVKAGGEYLQSLPAVDARRIGIWGGSYGGFLTALALARNSDIFKAGVDMHGVHNWVADYGARFANAQLAYEKPADIKQALDVAWKSSPVASISTWHSPVLLIQGDDDRNVRFQQTVDLARRLRAADVPFNELVLPDEIHGFLRHQSWATADAATVRFFDEQFGVRN